MNVNMLDGDIESLAEIAKMEPQLAYNAFAYGVSQRWKFLCRTTPHLTEHMIRLEEAIRSKFIPSLFGDHAIDDSFRKVLSLPVRFGGLGISNPSEECSVEYDNSLRVTASVTEAIISQIEYQDIDKEDRKAAIAEIKQKKLECYIKKKDELENELTEKKFRMLELAAEKGASNWLTTPPLAEYGFRLNKQQFADALCLRYDIPLKNVPAHCGCGQKFSVEHALTCKRGPFINLRHNTVRDTAHELISLVCKDVVKEPNLLPVTGEDLPVGTNVMDGARSDVSALSFFTPLSQAFFDIRVFNPLAQSNANKTVDGMYHMHESQKKREYNERILQVEKGSFVPVVFSCTGGAGPEASNMMKRLAEKISKKKNDRYSDTIAYIRRRFSFEIVKTCVMSFRGERRTLQNAENIQDLELEFVEYY